MIKNIIKEKQCDDPTNYERIIKLHKKLTNIKN